MVDFDVNLASVLQVVASCCVVTVATPRSGAATSSAAAAGLSQQDGQEPTHYAVVGVDPRLFKRLLCERFPPSGEGVGGSAVGLTKAQLYRMAWAVCHVERDEVGCAAMFEGVTRLELDAGETKAAAWAKLVGHTNDHPLEDGEWQRIEKIKKENGVPLLLDTDLDRTKMNAKITAAPADIKAKLVDAFNQTFNLVDSIEHPPPSGHNDIDTVEGPFNLLSRLHPNSCSSVALFTFFASKREGGLCSNLRALAPLISKAADDRKEKTNRRQAGKRGSHKREAAEGPGPEEAVRKLMRSLKDDGVISTAAVLLPGELSAEGERALWATAETTGKLADLDDGLGDGATAGSAREAAMRALAARRHSSIMGQLTTHANVVEAKQEAAKAAAGSAAQEEGEEEDEEQGGEEEEDLEDDDDDDNSRD